MESWFDTHRAGLVQCAGSTLRELATLNRGRLPPFRLPQIAQRLIAGLVGFAASKDLESAAKLGSELGRQGLVLASLQGLGRNLVQEAYAHGAGPDQIIALCEYMSALTGDLVEADINDLREQRDKMQGALERALRSREDEMKQLIQELSTPIMPIHDGILALPLIGRIDEERARRIMERLLAAIMAQKASIAIIDITGVPHMNTEVATALISMARVVQFLGARVLLVGIRPEIATTLTDLDVDLSGLVTLANLRSGIEHALRARGLLVGRARSRRRKKRT